MAVALPALTLAGFGAIGMAATGNTTIQTVVPDELRGRVMSVYTTVFAGSTPIGAIFAGAIASAANPVASLAAGGIGTLAVGLVGLAWLRRNREVADLAPRVAAAGIPAAAGRAQPLSAASDFVIQAASDSVAIIDATGDPEQVASDQPAGGPSEPRLARAACG